MAYGGYICEGCGRICGYVDSDGRCDDCGPLPLEEKELTPEERRLVAEARLHNAERERRGFRW
jgi:hypothetical protein